MARLGGAAPQGGALGARPAALCALAAGALAGALALGAAWAGAGRPQRVVEGFFGRCSDNLAGREVPGACTEPVDVVYSWVNSSDPVWAESLRHTRSRLATSATPLVFDEPDTGAAVASQLRANPPPRRRQQQQQQQQPQAPQEEGAAEPDFDAGANRFRDNGELRYSLRALEKHAPWVRRVFIVTDNQLPAWLDLENARVRVVAHSEFFANKSHLPTFSSPAIEANLVNIPGLADRFIYFNDDVLLGRAVWPEDFWSPTQGQVIYTSWQLPECAPGCLGKWLGDGICDTLCNVPACWLDFGDCKRLDKEQEQERPDVAAEGQATGSARASASAGSASISTFTAAARFPRCRPGCNVRYLADHSCDRECNYAACGYDGGDCDVLREWRGGFAWLRPAAPAAGANSAGQLLELPLATRAVGVDLAGVLGSAPVAAAYVHDAGVVLSASFSAASQTLVLVFGNPEAAALEHEQWGGASLSDVEASVRWECVDDVFLASCPAQGGCASFRTLHEAQGACAALGLGRCGGVTQSNRFEGASHDFQLRRGSEHQPSRTYERSCVMVRNPEPPTSTEPLRAREIVDIVIELADGASFNLSVTAGLHESRSLKREAPAASSSHRDSKDEEFGADDEDQDYADDNDGEGEEEEEGDDDDDNEYNERPSAKARRRRRRRSTARYPSQRGADSVGGKPAVDDDPGHVEPAPPDMFGRSMLHVSRLFHERFGRRQRDSIAHMPHWIDVAAMRRLQAAWPDEFERTSARHFRGPLDIQFAYSYMHWVVEEASLPALDERAYFASELDTDGDGKLGLNELRTLVALQLGPGAAQATVIKGMRRMVNCLNGREPDDPLAEADSVVLHFSFAQIMACDATATALRAALPRRQTFRVHDVKGPDSCVAFEMVSDDVEHVNRALDSIRARKPKFICINDNMQQPSPLVLRALRDFYDALYPLPSQFELRGEYNVFLALDEYQAHAARYLHLRAAAAAILLFLAALLLTWRLDLGRCCGEGAAEPGGEDEREHAE
jgi:hypothetical protein